MFMVVELTKLKSDAVLPQTAYPNTAPPLEAILLNVVSAPAV